MMILPIRSNILLAIANAIALGTLPAFATGPASSDPAGQSPGPSSSSELAELTPWPATRYEKLMGKSPFAPATAAPVQAATPGFAANLYLTGLGKIGDRDFVSISSRDQTAKISLFGGEPTTDGIQLVSVQWSDAVGKSKVTIKKGSEVAVLEYDQALLQKPVTVTPVPGAAVPPPAHAQNVRPSGMPRPGQPPGWPQVPQRQRTVINPPGGVAQPNQVGQPALQPNQGNQPNQGQPVIPTRRRSIIRSE